MTQTQQLKIQQLTSYIYPSAITKKVSIKGMDTQNHWFMKMSMRKKITRDTRKSIQ